MIISENSHIHEPIIISKHSICMDVHFHHNMLGAEGDADEGYFHRSKGVQLMPILPFDHDLNDADILGVPLCLTVESGDAANHTVHVMIFGKTTRRAQFPEVVDHVSRSLPNYFGAHEEEIP